MSWENLKPIRQFTTALRQLSYSYADYSISFLLAESLRSCFSCEYVNTRRSTLKISVGRVESSEEPISASERFSLSDNRRGRIHCVKRKEKGVRGFDPIVGCIYKRYYKVVTRTQLKSRLSQKVVLYYPDPHWAYVSSSPVPGGLVCEHKVPLPSSVGLKKVCKRNRPMAAHAAMDKIYQLVRLLLVHVTLLNELCETVVLVSGKKSRPGLLRSRSTATGVLLRGLGGLGALGGVPCTVLGAADPLVTFAALASRMAPRSSRAGRGSSHVG